MLVHVYGRNASRRRTQLLLPLRHVVSWRSMHACHHQVWYCLWKVYNVSSCADIKTCVLRDPLESPQRLCAFCPITWKWNLGTCCALHIAASPKRQINGSMDMRSQRWQSDSRHIMCYVGRAWGDNSSPAALQTRRLRWFEYVTRSTSCTNSITSLSIS